MDRDAHIARIASEIDACTAELKADNDMNPSHAEIIGTAAVAFAKLQADTQIEQWDSWDRMVFQVAFAAGYYAGLERAKRTFNEEVS